MKKKPQRRKARHVNKSRSGRLRILMAGAGLTACFLAVLGLLTDYAPPGQYASPESLSQPYTILESAVGTYFGPVVDAVYSGNGKFQYLAGGTYEGAFENSLREGEGTFFWENGDTFSGTWAGDAMVSGVYTFADGRSYVGDFEDNAFHNGVFSLGEACLSYGMASYEASLQSGEITLLDFETVDGLSFEGERTGEATIVYPSGDVYTGGVVDGIRNGEGAYVWASGPSYAGGWVDGMMSGAGEYRYTGREYPCLTATFAENKPQGNAVYSKGPDNTFDTVWENGVCICVAESGGCADE